MGKRKELYMPNASKSITEKYAAIAAIERDTGHQNPKVPKYNSFKNPS